MDRETVIEGLGGLMIKFVGCEGILSPIREALAFLISEPQIIRCKDCKYWEDPENCSVYDLERPEDWFCADGIAKDTDVPNK